MGMGMGMGPWMQGDLIRDIEKAERDRFRRAVNVEIKRLEGDPRLPDNEMLEMLYRIKAKIVPKSPKPAKRAKSKGYVEAEMGF